MSDCCCATTRASAGDTYRPDIDGLRAVAVLAVVAYHAFPAALPGGFVGVDVFFVISGYLITGILQRRGAALADFYARRIRRIFPALILVLAASLVAGWFVLLPLRYASLGTHVAAGAGFASNFLLWREAGYFDAQAIEKPLLHLWSLGIEEQFYLVWPALLWLLARLRIAPLWPLVALCALSFAAGLALSADAAFYLPVSRLWELGLGGVLACANLPSGRRPRLRAAGLALLAVALLCFDGGSPYPSWRALLPVVGAGLVIAAGPTAVLGNRVLVAVGLVSYPLYLWHWLLLSLGAMGGATSGAARLGLVAVSAVLATLTYLFVERPIRARPTSRLQALSLITALIIVAVAARIVTALDGVPERFPSVAADLLATRYDFQSDAHIGTCWLTATAAADGFDRACLPTAGGLFVWGDSHAARLRPGIERMLGTRSAIGSATRDACPPSLRGDGACEAGNRRVLDRLAIAPPATVLLFAHWSAYAPQVVDDLPALAARAHAIGVGRVIVIGPAPQWPGNLPTLVYAAWRRGTIDQPFPRRLASELDEASRALDRRMAGLPWSAGVEYVSLIELLCTRDGCLTYAPGSTTDLMSYDYGHLTTAGATVVARALRLTSESGPRSP